MQGIEFQIVNDSAEAAKSIEILTRKLNGLKTSLYGSSTAFKKASDGLNSISASLSKMNTGNFESQLQRISKGLNSLNAATQGLKVSASIGNQLSQIGSTLNNFPSGASAKLHDLANGLQPLSTIGKSNLTTFINQLKKLPEVIVSLDSVNMSKFTAQMTHLAAAIKPLASEMNKVAAGFSAFPTRIQRLITSTEKYNGTVQKATQRTGLWKKALAGVSFLQIVRSLSGAIKKSNEYIETMNLFSVSMGEYGEAAYDYAQKVSDVMGIDPAEWMRNQGVFNTIITGFGVAGDKAAQMSKNLTQLGYDLSSFYNISVADAMQKIQSGVSGELEPLRRLGYDLSVARLEEERIRLGIEKSVSSMTQAEKAQLRYYAMLTQVTDAQGDMARTLDDPANQLRILKAQLTQAARAIGDLFIPMLKSILPPVIAAVKGIREIVSASAALFGIEMQQIDWSSAESGSSALSDSMESAAESAKKLKSYTAGIDELNVLSQNTDSGEAMGGDLGIELPNYDFLAGAVTSSIDEWTAKMEPAVTWMKENLGAVLGSVVAVGTALASWRVGAGVHKAIGAMKPALTGIKVALAGISASTIAAYAAIAALVAGLAAVYKTNNKVKQSVDGVVESLGQSFKTSVSSLASTVVPSLKAAWQGLIDIFKPFGDWLGMVFTSIWMDMLVPAMSYMSDMIIPVVTTSLMNLWNNVLVPLGSFVGSVLTPVIRIVSDVLGWLWKGIIVPIASFVGGTFSAAFKGIAKIFNEVFVPNIKNTISVLTFLWDNVMSPIVTFVWNVLSPAFEVAFKMIGEVIGSVKTIFTGLIEFVTGVFTMDWEQAWGGVVDIFGGIFEGIGALITGPINACIGVFESFINKIIEGWNSLKRSINSMSFEIPEWLGGGTFGLELPMSSEISIPRLAGGGTVASGQMFIAREAGPELVGTIGSRTAVANNDQIVAGITNGVATANDAVVAAIYALLGVVESKDMVVNIGDDEIGRANARYVQTRGAQVNSGAFANAY